MMLTSRTIASGWRVPDPSSPGLCDGGGQILASLDFSDGSPVTPLRKSLNDRTECPVCGHVVAIIADFDGDSIAPHRNNGRRIEEASDQLVLFQ